MAILFRTQDTKSNWARKLNTLLLSFDPTMFREVPQTLQQWSFHLNNTVDVLVAAGYNLGSPPLLFQLGQTRQMWARKLNVLGGILAATPRVTALVAAPTSIAGNNTATSTLTATVRDGNGALVGAGVTVNWTTTAGTLTGTTSVTNGSGVATQTIKSAAAGSATVKAAALGGSSTATVTFT